MKNTFIKLLLVNISAIALFAISPATQAGTVYLSKAHGYYYCYDKYSNNFYDRNGNYYQCRWTTGHWEGNRWVYDQRVCQRSYR